MRLGNRWTGLSEAISEHVGEKKSTLMESKGHSPTGQLIPHSLVHGSLAGNLGPWSTGSHSAVTTNVMSERSMNRWGLSWCHPFQVFLLPVTFTSAHLGGRSHGATALIVASLPSPRLLKLCGHAEKQLLSSFRPRKNQRTTMNYSGISECTTITALRVLPSFGLFFLSTILEHYL